MTWTTHEETIHGTAVPIVYLLGFAIAFGAVSAVSKAQAGRNANVDAGSIPGVLSGIGLLSALLSVFVLFTSNWNYGVGWLFFSVAAFGAGASKAFAAAAVSGILNMVGFFVNTGTMFIFTGAPTNGFIDRYDTAACRSYFEEQDGTIDRCKDSEYLQLARSVSLMHIVFSFVLMYMSFQLAGATMKARN